MVGFNFLIGSLCFVINMVLKFLLWMIIMYHMENRQGMLVPETKQMMTTSEEKYILVSLIKLVKSLIIGLMRLIWSYSLVCRLSILQTYLLLLMHKRYADWLSSTLMISQVIIC